jgi:hypothetical protein
MKGRFGFFALPLLGEQNCLTAISYTSKIDDWLLPESFPVDSESHRNMEIVKECFAKACTIYVRRAASESASMGLSGLLQDTLISEFMDCMTKILPEDPGAHALVWPIYITGAETTDLAQRKVLTQYLERIYGRTKFRNISSALISWKRIWSRNDGTRWTQCLPQYVDTLVM